MGKHISFAIVNTKSIRSKANEFMVHIIEDAIDLKVICETWLKDDDTDITNFLESIGFTFYGHNGIDRPEGGLGILCMDTYKCTLEKQDSLVSFDYSIWSIEVDNSKSFHVVGIYRTLHSTMHPVPSAIFLDGFPDFVGDIVDSYKKFIICGDINIHCDMDENYEKQCLGNILDSFDLKQMVDVPTHERGHTLDVLIIPTLDNLIISSPKATYKILDHWFVECKIKFEKAIVQKKEIVFRPLSKIDDDVLAEKLSDMLHKSNLIDDQNLVSYFNNSMREIIDQLAPKKKKG